MQVGTDRSRRASTSDRLRPTPVFTHPVTFHYEIQKQTTRMQRLTKAFQVYRLMALTVICVLAGIVMGLVCRCKAQDWSERQFMYIELPGELYLRFLKLMIIPLLVSNVILSFGTMQGKISSKLAKVAGALYLASNLVAIVLAIVVATAISPGDTSQSSLGANSPQQASAESQLMANHFHLISNMHHFHEYRDSIARYREYHPMSFHHHHHHHHHHTNLKESPHLSRDSGRSHSTLKDHANQSSSNRTGDEDSLKARLIHVVLERRLHLRNRHAQNQATGPESGRLVDEDHATMLEIGARSQQDSSSSSSSSSNTHDTSQQADLDLAELAHFVKAIEKEGNLFRGGSYIGLSTKLPIDVVLDVLRNLVPESLIGATLQQSRTRLFPPRELRIDKNGSTKPAPNEWLMGHEMVNQPNIIGLLAMSVMAGVVLSHMGEASKPLLDLCFCISELSLRIGMKAIHTAPFCIMFLLIGQIARARDLGLIAGELFMYVITVIVALFIHGFIILPLVYYTITKNSPLQFFKGLLQALVAAFATSSSSATMALVLNCLSDLGVNLVIVRAFGPLGSVFNMNGTSIFEAVAVIFIAQTLGVKLPVTSLLLIGLCSAIASLSTSGIPSSGMMTMVIVLNAINLPVLELSLIYIVDFIIDRFRTVINVWSGAIVCGLIDHICHEELFEEEMKAQKYREMIKYRNSRTSLTSRKSSQVEEKPQVISVTITPPPANENSCI